MDDDAEYNRIRHVYDFAKAERSAGDSTSLTVTRAGGESFAGFSGRSVVCKLHGAAAGATAEPADPGERFKYVLRGRLGCDIAGDRVFASRGAILHLPVGLAHHISANADEDLLVFEVGDARRRAGAAEQPAIAMRYVYDMRDVHDDGRSPASADITPDAALRLPPGVTGKLLTGEHLHVGVLRLDPGARISNYRRDNEQLVFAAEGALEVQFDDEPVDLPQYSVLHLPAGTRHEIAAPAGAVIVIVQDKGEAG
jgi:quercetin dioxygenase-like cupin family protein